MPAGLQPLPVPKWKWEHIIIDFMVGLPWSQQSHKAIYVVIDRLTKSTHFLTYNMSYFSRKDELTLCATSSSIEFSVNYGNFSKIEYSISPQNRWLDWAY